MKRSTQLIAGILMLMAPFLSIALWIYIVRDVEEPLGFFVHAILSILIATGAVLVIKGLKL